MDRYLKLGLRSVEKISPRDVCSPRGDQNRQPFNAGGPVVANDHSNDQVQFTPLKQ